MSEYTVRVEIEVSGNSIRNAAEEAQRLLKKSVQDWHCEVIDEYGELFIIDLADPEDNGYMFFTPY